MNDIDCFDSSPFIGCDVCMKHFILDENGNLYEKKEEKENETVVE